MERALVLDDSMEEDEEIADLMVWFDNQPSSSEDSSQVETLLGQNLEIKVHIPSIVQPSKLELKPFPKHLRYVFLRNSNTLPVITSRTLTPLHEEKF